MSTDAEYVVTGVVKPAGRHVCLPDLLDQVRFRFDIAASSARLTDTQITYLLNRAREKLFKLLIDVDDARLRLTTTLTTEANVATVALPERTYAPVRLTYVDSDGRERDILPTNYADARLYRTNPNSQRRRIVYYTTSTSLVLVPTPATVQTLHFVYVAAWPDMAPSPSDFECWDGVQPEWDEYVLNDVLVTLSARSRRAEDVASFTSIRDGIEERLRNGMREESFEQPQFARRLLLKDDEDCGW